ncbi:MAG: hypothetical protein CM15mV8_0120 [Caudoviricetes sp.]|nr:MAG: hypothetical protein CM15mV8_0120 [Caudoviricetes sp.]
MTSLLKQQLQVYRCKNITNDGSLYAKSDFLSVTVVVMGTIAIDDIGSGPLSEIVIDNGSGYSVGDKLVFDNTEQKV